MPDERWKATYDHWKTTLPPEPYCDDEDCTCTTRRRDKFCVIHGIDPDEEYEKMRERRWDDRGTE